MKIDSVDMANFLAHEHLHVRSTHPIVVVAGGNAAGKSSLLDAVRWALLGRARGQAVKDVARLVRRGADATRCHVEVRVQGAGGKVLHVRRTPGGCTPALAHVLAGLGTTADVLGAVLHADTFVDERPYGRRLLAGQAVGARLTPEGLAAAGVTDMDVARAACERGTEAALRLATERRRAAQREAEAAKVQAPVDYPLPGGHTLATVDIAAVRRALDSIAAERDALRSAMARAEQAAVAQGRAQAAHAEAVAAAGGRDAAALLAQAAAVLAAAPKPEPHMGAAEAAAAAALREAQARVVRCEATVKEATDSLWGQVRAIARSLATVAPRAASDLEALAGRAGSTAPEAAAQALEGARAALRKAEEADAAARAAANAHTANVAAWQRAEHEARLLRAQAAGLESGQAALAAITAAPTVPVDAPASLAALDARAAVGRKVLEEVAAYRAAQAAHEAGAARAAAAMERAAGYAAMEAALRPDGAVGASLVDPRARLDALAGEVARAMGVPGVVLDEEWEVRVNGAPLALCSASEAWRVRAAFAIALASISGVRLVVLDEAAICVGQARAALVQALVAAGAHYDQVWLATSRGEREPQVVLPPALRDVVQVLALPLAKEVQA